MLNGGSMENEACSDTGPILHLNEIDQIRLLNISKKIFVSDYIKEELSKHNIKSMPRNVKLKEINKSQVAFLVAKYDLDLGEVSVIWLCKSLKINILLTDDLEARELASYFEIKPVGSVGIILRAYREGLIDKANTIKTLEILQTKSTLFVTSELMSPAINEVKKFNVIT